jgi:uncharacterized membrane protein
MNNAVVYGAIGGALVTFGLWAIVSKQIDSQLSEGGASLVPAIQEAVSREVPPAVHAQLTATLAEYDITAETGQKINQMLTRAEQLRLI